MSRERNDDELMVAIGAGDAMAFNTIVERWQGPLIGFFHRNLRDWQQAEDCSQDVLLRVYANAVGYVPCGTFKAWIFRIARNRLIDATRRRKCDVIVKAVRSRERDDDSDLLDRIAGESASPYSTAEANESIALVTSEVERLSRVSDDVVNQLSCLLDYCDGESLPEIAERRNLPLPTVKSQKRLAVQKLQELVMA